MKKSILKSTLISITILFGVTSAYASSKSTDCLKDKMGCEKAMKMKSDSMMKNDMKKDKM
ncbi:hypothetical protein [Actinobacillus minor]|uniref:hypothetical protein n=1 Tax=Actinobacillus minor TaxID=51047 RepID=UPI0005867607|nr:hypothetical protein [Actinobacillus minor]